MLCLTVLLLFLARVDDKGSGVLKFECFLRLVSKSETEHE